MKNPWENINLSDYENHMGLDEVKQLQTINEMMYGQLYDYDADTVIILGIAGGNGLNHINSKKIKKVYGLDINKEYINICIERYKNLKDIFYPIEADLTDEFIELPEAKLVIANLLIEYVGYVNFINAIKKIKPEYISCIIQVNENESFVSNSPYIHAFDELEKIHINVSETKLSNLIINLGYKFYFSEEKLLPNGKKLLRLDYIK